MNWIDITVIVIIVSSGIFAFFKGFVREALSIVGLVVSVILSFKFYRQLSIYLKGVIAAKPLREFITFIIIFLVLLAIVGLISYIVKKIFQSAGLSFYDKILGLVFGIVRGILIAYVIILAIEVTKIAPKDLKRAKTYKAVKNSVAFFSKIANKTVKEIKK